MSNRARLGVVVGAIIVVVVAFVALNPGDSSKKQDDPAKGGTQTSAAKKGGDEGPTASVNAPPKPITIKGGRPVGGVRSIQLAKGEQVRLQVNTDESHDTLHLHGYDIEENASASKPAIFRFKATIEGVFELESHTAEDAGREPLIARVVVEPN